MIASSIEPKTSCKHADCAKAALVSGLYCLSNDLEVTSIISTYGKQHAQLCPPIAIGPESESL